MGSEYQIDAMAYVKAHEDLSRAKKGSNDYFVALVEFIRAADACAKSCVIVRDRAWYAEKAHAARIRLEKERNPK